MAEVRPDNEEVKTIDLENIGTTDSLFTSVHGQKLMAQASNKVDELVHKKTSSTENKGLELTTNARLSRFEAEKIFANGWSNTSLDLLEALLHGDFELLLENLVLGLLLDLVVNLFSVQHIKLLI